MSDYITGQTALVEVGPIIDVLTGDPFDPPDLAITVKDPVGAPLTLSITPVETGVARVSIPLLLEGRYVGKWTWGSGDTIGAENFALTVTDELAFATISELAARLGRDLTAAETSQGQLLLATATGLILDAVDKDEDWAMSLVSVPRTLRSMCVEMVVRTIQNPENLKSQQEQLGAYLHGETFNASDGMTLTEAEVLKLRRTVFGTTTAGARGTSIADDLVPIYRRIQLGRDLDEDLDVDDAIGD